MSGASRKGLVSNTPTLLAKAIATDGGTTISATVPVPTASPITTICNECGRTPGDEPPAWDVLNDSEFDLLVELADLRAEIATRAGRIRVVLELLADVRDRIRRRAAAKRVQRWP